jgi:hypothetical protein
VAIGDDVEATGEGVSSLDGELDTIELDFVATSWRYVPLDDGSECGEDAPV